MLTPLVSGGALFESDGVVEVDAEGRIAAVADWQSWRAVRAERQIAALVDVRPWMLLPGLIDLHAHLPQVPNAGVGAGIDLLTWLDRYIFPLEQRFEGAVAEQLAPAVCRALAAAGTTTAVLYGAAFESSVETAFRAAEAHGLRAVIGQVLMDRLSYEAPPPTTTEVILRQSADLCARWNGRDRGRLRYAFTPRFAVSCTFELLRESAALARTMGAYWQTHLAEDHAEVAEVARLFPDARDYLDVYDRAGGLGPRSILAHAIHLSEREVSRLAESGARVAHCPESNLFLASGLMPLARYRQAGILVGLGSDIAGGPQLSIFAAMRAGAYTQNALRAGGDPRPILAPLDWLALGTLEGARALGIEDAIGSLEPGKEADLIVVDPELAAPLPGVESSEPDELMSRLIFRAHPEMVRGAWVRGHLLESLREAAPGGSRALLLSSRAGSDGASSHGGSATW